MKATINWLDPVRDAFLELSEREQEAIAAKLARLIHYPRMYKMRRRGKFRRHHFFVAANWAVYYRVVENTVWIRGLWPARMPLGRR